ncbi:MAG: ABC transporter substrate-binding protein [Acidobacteriales bacterium]|nr:ABC transporter substrate-binding protein [Terriglobales bacterium]
MGMYTPNRIVSLQPSVTVTLDRLDLLDRVVACTKWCVDVCPALRGTPHTIVADSWTARSSEILAARPDLVIASVPYQLEAVAEIMKAGIPFLGLAPHTLYDVYSDIARIAGIMGVPERGEKLILGMRSEIELVRQRTINFSRPLVYCEEWGKPLIHSQGWVAELIEAAGGTFLGTPGATTDEDAVREADPEVIIAAWCGAGDRVPLEKIIPARGWAETRAARDGRVYCINDEYLNTPSVTLLDGLRALAAAIHPIDDALPMGLRRIRAAVPTGG